MNKKEWNDEVPASMRNSFDNSEYKSQQVTSYWEVSDPNRKGYYMELSDEKGKVSRIWANDQGKISTTPYIQMPPKE